MTSTIIDSSSSSSSTSLLEKYANLHSDMEQARSEATACRSEMQTCQGQIQDLLEQCRIMDEATEQARHEQERLQQELDQQNQAWAMLQNEHDQVLQQRHDHAQHVQSMMQRRHETTRQDYEQSLQNFETACQQLLQGKIPLLPPASILPLPGTSTIPTSSTEYSTPHSYSQQDESHHDKENRPNNSNNDKNVPVTGTSSGSSPNINIMKIDWKVLFAQVLATTNEQVLQGVIQELCPDSVPKTTSDPSDQEESPVPLTKDQPLVAEQETPTSWLGEETKTNEDDDADKNIHGRQQDESKKSVVPGVQDSTDKKRPRLSTTSSSRLLFSQCVQVIDKLLLLKTQTADEAQEKLVAIQAQYHQARQDHDAIHHDHAQWLAKITRQRSQKEQLMRQLKRLQNDVKKLHQQIDQVHSQTLELQQQQEESQQRTGPKRQRITHSADSHDHDPSKTQVRNPYLPTTTNKSKRPIHESKESFVTRNVENDGPTNHPSKNKSGSSSIQRQVHHSSSSRHAMMISPLAETCGAHGHATTTTDHYRDRILTASYTTGRQLHRAGRVRGARDFGVSLSLESSTTFGIESHPVYHSMDNLPRPNASLTSVPNMDMDEEKETELFTRRPCLDERPLVQKPITSSSGDRTTPIVPSTGKEPVVVSAAKSRDSTTKLLLRRPRHNASSQDSCLSQDSCTTGSEDEDDHDNDDDKEDEPVFHFVFRK